MAIYQCQRCKEQQVVLRRWRYHLGIGARCPLCGSRRIKKLKALDKIDHMRGGFLNLLERLAGGKLYHCRFCRIQFYDRRDCAPANEPAENRDAVQAAQSPQRTA
jgi:DNA-directed RNA polymerase subunit RPC12/RpoP